MIGFSLTVSTVIGLCPMLIVSFPDDFSLSRGKIKIRLVICLFDFGSGVPECWYIVLY